MPRFEYQFDTKIDDRSRRFKRRVRLFLLFLLISAITAGGIWLIIPRKDKNSSKAVPESQIAADENITPAESVSEKTPAAPSGTVKDSELKDSKVADIPNNVPSVIDSEKKEPAAAADEKIITCENEPVTANIPSSLPEKGKIWAGDPVVDVPEKVENKNIPSQVNELDLLLNNSDYNTLADKALSVMQSENEGSDIYRKAAAYLLKARAVQLISSNGIQGVSYRYTVRGGDSLSRIARRNKTTVSGLRYCNKLDSALIKIGEQLLVHKGGWRIVVSKSKRLLKLYNCAAKEKLFAVFEVGVGRSNSTPVGEFVISSRIKSPEWHAPDGSIYKPGEPGNELGNYFLKLAFTGKPDRPLAGYGIHGTPDESTVGKSLSSGCIRMHNADVELLYNLVPERTPVNITE